jgi:hypothetical protein
MSVDMIKIQHYMLGSNVIKKTGTLMMAKEIVLSGLISKYHPVSNVAKDWKSITNEYDF